MKVGYILYDHTMVTTKNWQKEAHNDITWPNTLQQILSYVYRGQLCLKLMNNVYALGQSDLKSLDEYVFLKYVLLDPVVWLSD